MKNLAIITFGGLFFLTLQLFSNPENIKKIQREKEYYDSLRYLYDSDSSEINHLRRMRAEEKGEGK